MNHFAVFESESLPEFCAPVPTPNFVLFEECGIVKEELAREVARVQGQPASKVEDSETSDESGPLPVPKSARVACWSPI